MPVIVSVRADVMIMASTYPGCFSAAPAVETLTSVNLADPIDVDDKLPILSRQSTLDLESLLFEPRPERERARKSSIIANAFARSWIEKEPQPKLRFMQGRRHVISWRGRGALYFNRYISGDVCILRKCLARWTASPLLLVA